MIVLCPNCGAEVPVHGLGRKRLDIPLKNICEALRSHRGMSPAARELGCSQGYIYNSLKAAGLKLSDVLKNTSQRQDGVIDPQ
ncbi:MAG: hypothetical protein WC749_12175 [Dehalococcoidia bacterium]